MILFHRNSVAINQSTNRLISGALLLSEVTEKDSGTYWCSAVNSLTNVLISIPEKIVVTVAHGGQRFAPRFLSNPSPLVSVRPGATAILECPIYSNPRPIITWSRSENNVTVEDNEHTSIMKYGLQIRNVTSSNDGDYYCRATNGIGQSLVHKIRLQVLEAPTILVGLKSTLTNETESLTLFCRTSGRPRPEIYWMINGENTKWDSVINHMGNEMIIRSVEKRHAGIVQCFARNEVGEVFTANLLQVNPKQIPGEIGGGGGPLGSLPQSTKSNTDHTKKPPKGHKKHKNREFYYHYYYWLLINFNYNY